MEKAAGNNRNIYRYNLRGKNIKIKGNITGVSFEHVKEKLSELVALAAKEGKYSLSIKLKSEEIV